MANRWKVQRTRTIYGGLHQSRQWGVIKPGEEGFDRLFGDRAGALAYADRMARTITVTLPRLGVAGKITEVGCGTRIMHTDQGAAMAENEYDPPVPLINDELEDVALYLLAVGQKNGDKHE